jgi:integrase
LRQGESLGLQWGSVLWESSRLVIERQAVQEGGKVSIRQPKTQASIRVIQVPQVVMRMLQRLYEKAQASNRAEPSDFVFSNDNGGPISRLDFTRCTWKPLLKRLGIGHRGAHHGRHYCASVLLQNGTPIVEVASYLGHRNAGFTLSIYAHLIARGGSVAAATLDRVFGDLEQERGE